MAGQIDALTSIRGLAAWWVVVYHSRAALNPYLAEPVAPVRLQRRSRRRHALRAVRFRHLPKLCRADSAVPNFDFRFLRAQVGAHLPAAFRNAAGFRGLCRRTHLSGSEAADNNSAAYFVQSLFLVQNLGLTSELSWNVPAWSISTEMFAYLTFPVIVLLADWRRLPIAVLAILVVACPSDCMRTLACH